MGNRDNRLVLIAALVALVACTERPAEAPPAVADGSRLVELEAQFAAASRERGAKAAFLEVLAEDSIVLQPGPVPGRATWEANEEVPATLDWAPDRAQMSLDGRFGFASGRWTLTPKEEGGPAAEGRYVTVWHDAGAGFKVVFDGGFARARSEAPASVPPPQLDPAQCSRDATAQPGDLQVMDLGLSGKEGEQAYAERVRDRAAPGLVVFHPPNAEGAGTGEEIAAALAALPATTQLAPMGAGMAGAGDLGFTYGLSAPAADAAANAAYVHIWCRRPDGWRLLLELRGKLPPPAPPEPAG